MDADEPLSKFPRKSGGTQEGLNRLRVFLSETEVSAIDLRLRHALLSTFSPSF